MSHVADGELHAYLDGALDLYPSGEAARIRSHLETCPECRARLEEEKGIREAAAGVLSRTGPAAVEVPPFETVRRRAAAGRGGGAAAARRPGLATRLGWAASVLVALGVGWMAGRLPGVGAGGASAPAAAPAADRASGQRAPSTVASARSPAELAEDRLSEGETIATLADAGAVEAKPGTALVEEAGEGVVAAAPPGELADASAAVASSSADSTVVERMRIGASGRVLPRVEQAARLDTVVTPLRLQRAIVEPDTVARARMVAEERMAEARTDEARRMVDSIRAAAREEDAPGRALVIPGLEVVRVEWTEVAPGVEGLRVVQRVTGDTIRLELRFGGLERDEAGAVRAADPDDAGARAANRGPPGSLVEEPLPEGVFQVAERLEGGAGWVVLRGRLPRQRLERLLDLIR